MRKRILFSIGVLLSLSQTLSAGVYEPKKVRREVVINREWTFNYFPSGIEDFAVASVPYDDSRWKAIALPHTWSTYETTGDIHPYMKYASEREDSYWWNGWGWYRKRIVFGPELKDKRIFIEFEGVQKYCKVYLNGTLLGDHKGGYTGFYFDITSHIVFGRENVISVAVSNRRDDKFGTIPPATAGNFNVYGGIYRDVKIVVKEDIHIPFQGSYEHEGGTFVTTPAVSKDAASVAVRTWVRNDSGKTAPVTVKTIVADADSRIVQSCSTEQTLKPGELCDFFQQSETIRNPHLWSPESPYLYNVYTEVYSGNKLTDTYRSPLGFRWFEWDHQANCLMLNGERVHIHGTNRHQEFPWVGDAMPHWLTEKDMMDIRYGMNTNFMRTAHYPHDPIVYDFNDRHGIITVEEYPNIKAIQFDRNVQENNMREMVRRDRNHPSILFWSVGNETSQAADSEWAYSEDTTRIIHERKTEMYGDYVTHHATNLDMENLLRVTIRGWTDKDVKNLEPRNSAAVEKSGQQAGTEEWQHKMARVDDGSIRGRIDRDVVGWLYEDHGCDRLYKDAPLQNINYKGWVDMYRIPKYMYYLWQANYLPEPMVFIHPHYWQGKYTGTRKTIQIDSNCDQVELFVNGVKTGEQFPSKENFHTVEFEDVEIVGGTIRAVGIRNGKIVAEQSVQMAGAPARIVLCAERGSIPADRSGIDIITADIVDCNGVHVIGCNLPLHWEVSGEGTLVGHHTYTTDLDKALEMEGTGYVTTPVSNIVRSTDTPGHMTLKVSSPGLEPAEITITTRTVDRRSIPGIAEPLLSDKGRMTTIPKNKEFRETVEYIEELKPIFGPRRIEASSKNEYRVAMVDFVASVNPGIDTGSVEFECLIQNLTSYIENTKGELTEDDYNFIAKSYNDLRLLSRVVENRNFHPEYTAELKLHYSRQMILENKVTDVDTERAKINAIPGEIDIVMARNPEKSKQPAPLQYGNTVYRYSAVAATLEELISLMRPEFVNLTREERQQFMEYVAGINPAVESTIDGYAIAFDRAIAIPREIKNGLKF